MFTIISSLQTDNMSVVFVTLFGLSPHLPEYNYKTGFDPTGC